MAERSSVSQVVQLGIETTPGTAVAASKKLAAMAIETGIAADVNRFRPAGHKVDTVTAINKESVEADISGQPTYTEIIYPLASLLTNPVSTQIMDGATPTGAYTHVFTPAITAEDAPKTFTIEHGSAFRAHRFAYGLVTELGLEFSRDSVSMDGAMIGTRMEDGITLTAALNSVELVPILPSQVDIYLDATSGGLGTTKLARVLSAELSIGDRYNPLWVLDSSKNSWVAHVETAVDATLTVTVEADAQGMGLLTQLRDGATRFIRVRAKGANIYTGGTNADYLFQADMAAKLDDVGDFSDADGLYAIEWTFRVVYDTTWAKWLTISVVNKLASL